MKRMETCGTSDRDAGFSSLPRATGEGRLSPDSFAPFWSPAGARGFLLDWDGVLAETRLDFAPLRQKWFGGRRVLLWEAAWTLPPERREAYREEIRALEMEGAERAEPVPGALELIRRIRDRGLPWIVLSRNCRDSILRAAEVARIPLPPAIVSRDDPGPLKPDPGSVRGAAAVLGLPVRECVLVGDFLFDMMAARRAGCRAVLVRRPVPEQAAWADVSYAGVEDLVREMDEPVPRVPFEWSDLVRERGRGFLLAAHGLAFLPGSALVDAEGSGGGLDGALLGAAARGVGEILLPPRPLSPELARRNPALDPSLTGLPLPEAAARFLEPRFPLVRVLSLDGEAGLPAETDSVPDATGGPRGGGVPSRPRVEGGLAELDRAISGVLRRMSPPEGDDPAL